MSKPVRCHRCGLVNDDTLEHCRRCSASLAGSDDRAGWASASECAPPGRDVGAPWDLSARARPTGRSWKTVAVVAGCIFVIVACVGAIAIGRRSEPDSPQPATSAVQDSAPQPPPTDTPNSFVIKVGRGHEVRVNVTPYEADPSKKYVRIMPPQVIATYNDYYTISAGIFRRVYAKEIGTHTYQDPYLEDLCDGCLALMPDTAPTVKWKIIDPNPRPGQMYAVTLGNFETIPEQVPESKRIAALVVSVTTAP
jgi:hypothetical protein